MAKTIHTEAKQQRSAPPHGTHFSLAGLKFLRGLARNNNRDWFNERKAVYEAEVKRPMLAVIEAVTAAMVDFAPAHVRAPEKIMMRIYRDTRFAKEKVPYKTHVAGWWVRDGLVKTSGAGFYLHISGAEVEIAAGVFMPDAAQLLALRRMLLERAAEYRVLAESRAMKKLFQQEEGMPLSRSPKGFPAEHPAASLFRQRRWGVHAEWGAEAAAEPAFSTRIADYFRAAAPLVAFLNEPLVRTPKRRPMF